MTIPFTLNEKEIQIEANADDTLLEVLRKNSCLSVKCGCSKGYCGSCTVLLDDKPVASCKIPFALIKKHSITTLEHFSKTNEYSDIIKGFSKAGIKLCGYCDAGKIFCAYKILKIKKSIKKEDIAQEIKHLAPCCTDRETLITGISNAIKYSNIRNRKSNQEK